MLCAVCKAALHDLVADWSDLCDVLGLDDEQRVSGVILATLQAVDRCDHPAP